MAEGIIHMGLFCISVLILSVNGFGNGAPAKACVTLMPGHSVAPQTSPSPYSIMVSATEYKANQPITVTVYGSFRGLLLQARKADGSSSTPIGTFTGPPADTKLTPCTTENDSWTHGNANNKTDISIMWNPPSGNMGNVVFRATVALMKNTYWMNIQSAQITSNSTDGSSGTRLTVSGLLMCLILLVCAFIKV